MLKRITKADKSFKTTSEQQLQAKQILEKYNNNYKQCTSL